VQDHGKPACRFGCPDPGLGFQAGRKPCIHGARQRQAASRSITLTSRA
jgi:hypothetical protein